MLDDTLKAQLAAYLERVTLPFEMVASLDDSETSRDMRSLLETIQGLRADMISVRFDGADARKPSFSLQRTGTATSLRFAGLPLGHEFTSLVLALLWTGGHPPKVEQDVIDQIKSLDGDFNFDVYMSLTCHNCPDVVQALALMAIFNPKVKTTVIEGGAFQQEVTERDIMAVPMVFLNGQMFSSGHMLVEEIVGKLDTGAAAKDAAKLSAKDPYDVLIIGGGPAGAAAAIYAARKGIRTGVAAERFGGQVNDTMAIENYPSVQETDGPKFAAALESQTRSYGVDIMNLQVAQSLVPAAEPGGLIEVKLANGGSQRTRRAGIQKQGRGLLPALRRPAVQRQRRGGDWWRQLRHRGGYRPGRCGQARHGHRVYARTQSRRRAGEKTAQPAQRDGAHQCADHGNYRQWLEIQGPRHRGRALGQARRRVRANRPGSQHRMAQRYGGTKQVWRNHCGCQRPHQRARSVCGG